MQILLGDGIGEKKRVDVKEGSTIADVIKRYGANSQTVVLVLNGQVAHPQTPLKEGDELELVGVIYGG